MKRDTLIGIGLLVGSILLTFAILEGVVRVYSEDDKDGNIKFVEVKLRPYRIPLVSIQESLDKYNSSTSSRLMYDPNLGWSPRPNAQDWVYFYNSAGIRSAPSEYSVTPKPGVLRIALFGDSYTHCDEVSFEDCWGTRMEARLNKKGVPAEVINFGVSGYGIDQAFLRWREQGQTYAPDIVILGFNADDVGRNVNLLRPIFRKSTGIPLAKPRFIIEGDQLRIINVPTTPPDRVMELIQNVQQWDLVGYEYFFQLGDYEEPIWLKSRLLSFVSSFLADRRTGDELYLPGGEPAQVTLRIIEQFSMEARAAGSQFLVVFLPQHDCLEQLSQGERLPYADLLAAIEQNHTVIHPETPLLEVLKTKPVEDVIESHYTPKGNRLIGDSVADYLLASPLVTR
jgi:hypothetical protein